jgi:hypothetical protein
MVRARIYAWTTHDHDAALTESRGCASVREQPGAAKAQHRGRRATGSIPPRRSTCRRAVVGRRAGGLAAGRAVPRGGAGWGGVGAEAGGAGEQLQIPLNPLAGAAGDPVRGVVARVQRGPPEDWLVLGIESSCEDTAAARRWCVASWDFEHASAKQIYNIPNLCCQPAVGGRQRECAGRGAGVRWACGRNGAEASAEGAPGCDRRDGGPRHGPMPAVAISAGGMTPVDLLADQVLRHPRPRPRPAAATAPW